MERIIRLVSFDVWDTLLSINMFYRATAEHLSHFVTRPQSDLERSLIEGYGKLRKIRRSGGLDDSKIVQMTLEAMSKILDVDPSTLRKATSQAVMDSSSEQYVIDGAVETLKVAKTYGLAVAIIGNVVFWPGDYNRILLKKAGLSKYIDAQIYADEVAASKPKPEIFRKVLTAFSLKPDEVIHVGDSLFEDLVGAVFSGIGAVLIDPNSGNWVKLHDWNAHIVPDIKCLEQVLSEQLPSSKS